MSLLSKMKSRYKKKRVMDNVSYVELPIDADKLIKLLDEIKKKQLPVEQIPVEEEYHFSLQQKKVIYLMRGKYSIHEMAVILNCCDGNINDLIRRIKDKVGVKKRSELLKLTAGIKL